MTRLFYTCPIRALYMMKEFDVKLKIKWKGLYASEIIEHEDDFENITKIYQLDSWGGDSPCLSYEEIELISVAPESEHIFDLKEGDYFISNDPYDGEGSIFQSDGSTHDQKICEKIIMRDNRQFFAAEVENDK